MNLRNVLIGALLIVLCMSDNLYANRYQSLTQVEGSTRAIGFSPRTMRSYFGEYIDIAIADSREDIYFYNKGYHFQYVSTSKLNQVQGMQWNQIGLYIVGPHQIKVVNPELYNWTIFQIKFNNRIDKYAFSFDKDRNLFLTAVSFSSTLQMYENQTMVASFNISEPCLAMSYHPNKKLFFFAASVVDEEEINFQDFQKDEDSSYLYMVDLKTNQIIEKSQEMVQNQKSMAFVNDPKYSHLSISVSDKEMHLWNNCTLIKTYRVVQNIDRIYFTEKSDLLILAMGNDLASMKVNLNEEQFINPHENFEALVFDSKIVDIAIKRNKILVLAGYNQFWVISSSNKASQSQAAMGFMMFITCVLYFIVYFACVLPFCCPGSEGSSSSSDSSNNWSSGGGGCDSSGCGGGGGSTRHDHG